LTSSPRISPNLALFFGILAVSTASIFIRFAQAEAPSIVIAAYRMLIASLLMLPFALRRRSEYASLDRRSIGLLLLAGIFLAVHFAAWITSLELTSVASSVVLVTTTPLWVAIISPFVLRERLSPVVWVGLVFAMVGAITVGVRESCQMEGLRLVCAGFGGSGAQTLQGNLLALTGAFMAAGYITVGRQVRARLSLLSYTFLVYSTSAVLLLLLALVTRQPMTGYSPAIYGWFVAMALIPQVLGHSIFNWALRYLPAANVSIALLGEPVGTTILAMLLLRESPTAVELIGGGLILFGIYLASRRSA
jgi:drug/metabolite transporter (DMT)-like permease